MIVDINLYIGSKSFILSWHRRKGNIDKTISMMPSVTFVPCIAVAIWIGEHDGWTPEIVSRIESIIAFYGYTKINGKPEGCPILI
jgi:hypothetical protein